MKVSHEVVHGFVVSIIELFFGNILDGLGEGFIFIHFRGGTVKGIKVCNKTKIGPGNFCLS